LITIFFIAILLSCKSLSNQNIIGSTNFEDYSLFIDSLIFKKKLKKYYYMHKSCGGSIKGYFKNNELVSIVASNCGEYSCYNQKIYLKENEFYKIIYTEHIAELEKFYKKYPNTELDLSKLSYSDTIYEIYLGKKINLIKKHKGNIISNEIDSILISQLLRCGKHMIQELNSTEVKEYKY